MDKIEELGSKNERYSETVEMNLADIPIVEASRIDPLLYVGKKLKIENMEIKKEIDYYPDGQNYDPKSTETIFRVYLFTEPLRDLVVIDPTKDLANPDNYKLGDKILEKTDDDGNVVPIRVNCRFNLQQDDKGQPEISKAPSAKLWKFMRKLGALTLPELKDKYVMLDAEPSKNPGDDRKYLKIVQ